MMANSIIAKPAMPAPQTGATGSGVPLLSDAHPDRRQASEQYFTSFQFFAHFFRQIIGRPQMAQDLVGR